MGQSSRVLARAYDCLSRSTQRWTMKLLMEKNYIMKYKRPRDSSSSKLLIILGDLSVPSSRPAFGALSIITPKMEIHAREYALKGLGGYEFDHKVFNSFLTMCVSVCSICQWGMV